MNIATKYLRDNWGQFGLDSRTPPERVSWVVLTPSFPASGHVIFFLLSEGTSDPLLVMKVSRLPGEDVSLKREASNLQLVHSAREGGFASIPRLLDYGFIGGNPVMIETALLGRQMNRAFVRHHTKWSIEAVLQWVIELHSATSVSNTKSGDWFARLVDIPLARLVSLLPLAHDEEKLVDQVYAIAESLRKKEFPLVFSHGDLSDPNILVLRNGGIGVVDWETAEPESLPGADLFFFLKFVGSIIRSSSSIEHVTAFRRTFCSSDTWIRDHVARYAEAIRLDKDLLGPLLVLCFSRYLSDLALRMCGTAGTLDVETVACLRSEPAYMLWRASVQYSDQFCLC